MARLLDECGEVNLETFVNEVFYNRDAKAKFEETLASKGVRDDVLKLAKKTVNNHLQTVKLQIDNGIEILVPIDIYTNQEKFRLERDGQGRIRIHIEGVEAINSWGA